MSPVTIVTDDKMSLAWAYFIAQSLFGRALSG
jgi:hypothetical protein